jgi:Tol biopolymer transport system component
MGGDLLRVGCLLLLALSAGCHWILPFGTVPSDSGPVEDRGPVVDGAPADNRRPEGAPADQLPRGDAGLGLGPAELVQPLSSPQWETDPVLTQDCLTIYFSSSRPGGKGGMDLYLATRAAKDLEFGSPVALDGLNSANNDYLGVTPDDVLAVLSTGPDTGEDLWLGSRDATDTPWSLSQFALIAELNTSARELDPRLSPDGLRLYYATTDYPGASGQQLVVAERPALDLGFGQPALVLGSHAGLHVGAVDADPAISFDERVLVFTTIRPGKTDGDLWVAVRADRDQPFATPQPLTEINTAAHERDAFITADGEWLYFASTDTRLGQQDIFRARILAWP